MPHGIVSRDESVAEIRRALKSERGLPDAGEGASQVLKEATSLLFEHSLFNGHPRFFGYITSSPAPLGALGDFLAAMINQNVGVFRLSPLATEIEAQTIRWIAELIGYPAGCGGLLVSGATWRTLSASSRPVRPRLRGTCERRDLRSKHGFWCMPRPRRIHGFRKRQTCLDLAPRPFAGFRLMPGRG
jgi:hypothetical protein